MVATVTFKPGAQRTPRVPTLRVLFSGNAGVVDEPARALRAGKTLIGREVSGDGALCLPQDPVASRQHAQVQYDPTASTVTLHDCNSHNGVFINGTRCESRQLRDSDVLRIGSSFLLFRLDDPDQIDVPDPRLLGAAPGMAAVRLDIRRVGPTDATVLIQGQTGTGKELVARSLHDASGRQGRFIAVNCSAIPETLAESQLFGHVAGAFTGATRDHEGFCRAAQEGTLFLDEIGDMPTQLQPKLLRVLEQRSVIPVGATTPIPFDARVIAATHASLVESIQQQSFRQDLYARLAQFIITLPPLRERAEDVLMLLALHLERTALLSPELVDALLGYHWPNNIRELLSIATELRVRGADAAVLDLDLVKDRLLPSPMQKEPQATVPLAADDGVSVEARQAQTAPEVAPPPDREQLKEQLAKHRGNLAQVAREVGRSRTQVYRWVKKYGLEADDFRDE